MTRQPSSEKPEDAALTELLAQWKPLLKPGCDRFRAEMTGVEFLAVLRGAVPDDVLPDILGGLIAQAAASRKPEALAMLRVLAIVGPHDVRDDAADAADALVSAGMKDRPWVKGLGYPEVAACFGNTDLVGAQETLAVTFSYGAKTHALIVLIDHTLGSGVKDVWVTDDPEALRTQYREASTTRALTYEERSPAQARSILDSALSVPPCPEQEDQVDDVRDYLDLLRQRVALLPISDNAVPRSRRSVSHTRIYRLLVTIRGSHPPIWRRLEVPSEISLNRLHDVIQEAFGWHNYHMWVFENSAGRYGLPDRELGHSSAARTKLSGVATRKGSRLLYTYDFGDDWEHDILVEETQAEAAEHESYPRCVAGERAGPPEDCGGIWGYGELLEILGDPSHEEHEWRLEWLGLESATDFDPAHFDLEAVNKRLTPERAQKV